jgi:hypothetical protein
LYIHTKDDEFSSQVQVEDNGDNRKGHHMVQKDEQIISMDLLQAIQELIYELKKNDYQGNTFGQCKSSND